MQPSCPEESCSSLLQKVVWLTSYLAIDRDSGSLDRFIVGPAIGKWDDTDYPRHPPSAQDYQDCLHSFFKDTKPNGECRSRNNGDNPRIPGEGAQPSRRLETLEMCDTGIIWRSSASQTWEYADYSSFCRDRSVFQKIIKTRVLLFCVKSVYLSLRLVLAD